MLQSRFGQAHEKLLPILGKNGAAKGKNYGGNPNNIQNGTKNGEEICHCGKDGHNRKNCCKKYLGNLQAREATHEATRSDEVLVTNVEGSNLAPKNKNVFSLESVDNHQLDTHCTHQPDAKPNMTGNKKMLSAVPGGV